MPRVTVDNTLLGGVNHEDAAISGTTNITTTAVVLGSQAINGPLAVKAKDGNTGVIYIGNTGADTVSSSTGFELGAGDSIVFSYVANLSCIYAAAASSGDDLYWLALEVY